MSSPRLLASLLLPALTALAACGDDGDEAMAPVGPPAAVTAVSGNNQTGTVGEALANSISVRVADSNGNGVPGVSVEFATTDGSVSPVTALAATGTGASARAVPAVTNSAGDAGAQWTLGTAAGGQTATATVEGLPPVTFTATANAGAAASLSILSGSGQEAPAGQALPQPLVVLVQDQFSNPVSGETVSWAVSSGDGTLSQTSSTTDASGQASTMLTLGPTTGPITVAATVTGLTAVTFDASACVELISGAGCPVVQPDPSGDTFETAASAGLVIPDILSIAASTDGTDLVVQMTFVSDVASDWTSPANAVTGYLDLDTDQNPATGIESNVDFFRPDAGTSGMGMDYYVDVLALDAASTYGIFDAGFNQVGSLVPVFSGNTVTMTIPLSVIGNDDGRVDIATLVGTELEPTDVAPDNGNFVFNGAPGAGSARPARTPPHDPNDRRGWKRER